jgi:DNA invertase Pin-like site-specific DNA recombinase
MADLGGIVPDDPEDPMRTAMRQMMGVFAQLDRGMTVAKLRRGRRIKGEKGEYAYGAPPYGWQAHKKDLTPEEMEQAALAGSATRRSCPTAKSPRCSTPRPQRPRNLAAVLHVRGNDSRARLGAWLNSV